MCYLKDDGKLSKLSFLLLFLSISVSLHAQIWVGKPQVIQGESDGKWVEGCVFFDENRNSSKDNSEQGIANVLVSNGKEWAQTDSKGYYRLPVRPDMNLTVVQPSGWRLPTNENWVPQFFYMHKELGTKDSLRYGGLAPTGSVPSGINFPIIQEGAPTEDFSCAVLGDPQAYTNQQLSWLRQGVLTDVLDRSYKTGDFMLQLGDIVGDDLALLPRSMKVSGVAQMPVWYVIGNHDIDLDASANSEKADTWRATVGPDYYAFEAGNVLFVVLDNVFYPCTEADAARGIEACAEGKKPTYVGRIDAIQWEWLEGLIAHTPADRQIVLASHIPLVSSVDGMNRQHQTDDLPRLYRLLEGRKVLSLSGHTHTTENHAPGQVFAGWTESLGIGPLPFRHIIAGAASGSWYQGDFTHFGIPMALQRMGTPMGYVHLDFTKSSYQESYTGARLGSEQGQWIGLNTPAFRQWFEAVTAWTRLPDEERSDLPPYSINDLNDNYLLDAEDFEQGVWLTANVWLGDAETRVEVTLSDGRILPLERTQSGTGEALKEGAEWADPFAAMRQLSVARYAYQSSEGDARAQGMELFRGNNLGPIPPRPQFTFADRNMHLWRLQLPQLPLGVHVLTVTSTNRFGLHYSDKLVIEVCKERPTFYWNGR